MAKADLKAAFDWPQIDFRSAEADFLPGADPLSLRFGKAEDRMTLNFGLTLRSVDLVGGADERCSTPPSPSVGLGGRESPSC